MKYLYFNNATDDGQVDAAHDVYCVPVSAFRGFTNQSTTRTQISLLFDPVEGDIDDASVSDVVVLNITTDTHKTFIETFLKAIKNTNIAVGDSPLISVADDMLGTSLDDAGITGIASITVQVGAGS